MDSRNRIYGACVIGIFGYLAMLLAAPMVSASPLAQSTPAALTATPTPLPQGTPSANPSPSPGERTWVVEPGDTLWAIATQVYGNGSKYPAILRANNLPENAILQVGSVLVIPALADAQSTPSPKPSVQPTPTPFSPPVLPSPTLLDMEPVAASPNPTPLPGQTELDAPNPSSTNPAIVPWLPFLSFAMNVLSVVCFLGSLFCAVLSLDAYRYSRRFARRDYIGRRIHVKA